MAQLTSVQGVYEVGDSADRHTVQKAPIGAKAYDAAGNEYTYVKFGGVVAATDAVSAGATAGLSAVLQSANTATGAPFLGVAGAAAAANDFGYVLTRGVVSVKAGNVTAGAAVCPKTTAGTVNDLAAADFTSRQAQAVSDDSGGLATILLL